MGVWDHIYLRAYLDHLALRHAREPYSLWFSVRRTQYETYTNTYSHRAPVWPCEGGYFGMPRIVVYLQKIKDHMVPGQILMPVYLDNYLDKVGHRLDNNNIRI